MDIFDLSAKITLDSKDYESGIRNAQTQTSGFSDKLKSGLATAGKIAGAGLAAAAAGIVSIGKSAFDAYSDYEQLVGGVDTLFGESSAKVQEYAANAYKTAGMSANAYMETVTGFSASLLQSLGGDTNAAAESANQALIDMSDNANKMGTSMESIQFAYQGFAKQNYTMLDNLKLGYGGTKEEMERLLSDAEKLTGQKYDISNLNDVYSAIHAVQTELGITGTTAEEASTTIQGSISSMKSAWTNWLTGLADENANLAQLSTNLIDSVSTVAKNAAPVVETVLEHIAQAVSEEAPGMISKFVQYAVEKLPEIIELGVQLIVSLTGGLIQALPQLLKEAPQIIWSIVKGVWALWKEVFDLGAQIVSKIGEGFKSAVNSALQWGKDLIQNFINGILSKWNALKNTVSNAAQTVKDFLGFSEPKKGPLSNFHTYAPDMMELFAQGIRDNEGVVANQIAKSFDFGTATIDFGASAQGVASSGIVNGLAATQQSTGGVLNVNLVLPDGTKIASYLLNPLIQAARQNGTPIANPVV